MTHESVSFRITRNTEDLAHTIHTLSQRVVTLEQRLAAIDLLIERRSDPDPDELASLDNVERLLDDCRQLLDLPRTADLVDAATTTGTQVADDDDHWPEAA